jgi:hypothetical protein
MYTCLYTCVRVWFVVRSSFVAALTSAGGVVEACPAVVTGSPSANVFIEPDGTCTVTSTHDQIFARPYTYAGTRRTLATIFNLIYAYAVLCFAV